MTSQTLLPTMLRGFFEDYLAAQRDVSPNTILAYRDAIKLLLGFEIWPVCFGQCPHTGQ